jgi:hypothetical protein
MADISKTLSYLNKSFIFYSFTFASTYKRAATGLTTLIKRTKATKAMKRRNFMYKVPFSLTCSSS